MQEKLFFCQIWKLSSMEAIFILETIKFRGIQVQQKFILVAFKFMEFKVRKCQV